MFKIEITKPSDSSVHGFYWMNKHADDFLQFVPAQFTRHFGEVITKDDIVVIKIDEAQKDVLEGKLMQEHCELDCEESGKIKVIKTIPAEYDEEGVETSPEVVTTELELTGTTIAWPYDESGNFTGNN